MIGVESRRKRLSAVTIIAVAALAAVASACGGSGAASQTPLPTHALTHTAADAEFVIGWAAIVRRCPAIGKLQKVEAFARRGEEVQSGPDDTLEVTADGPVAWASQRFVSSGGEGGSRTLRVQVSFLEKVGKAEAQVRRTGQTAHGATSLVGTGGLRVAVKEGDGFVVVQLDSITPIRSEQRFVAGSNRISGEERTGTAGDNLLVHFIQTARSGPLLCGAEQLETLAFEVGRNIHLAEMTPQP